MNPYYGLNPLDSITYVIAMWFLSLYDSYKPVHLKRVKIPTFLKPIWLVMIKGMKRWNLISNIYEIYVEVYFIGNATFSAYKTGSVMH